VFSIRKHAGITVAAIGAALSIAAVADAATHRAAKIVTFELSGSLASDAGVNATSLTLQTTGGNGRALRAIIGVPQPLVVKVGTRTAYRGIVAGKMVSVASDALKATDPVSVTIRAPQGSKWADLALIAASRVVDTAGKQSGAVFIFRGTATPGASGAITLHVTDGNYRALKLLLGQSQDETFATDVHTKFVRWNNKKSSVITFGDIKPNDVVTIRIRIAGSSSLADVLARPAALVVDREPAPISVG
jgi:hypothetical protein